MESAEAFRKALIAGYDACAITKTQFGQDIEGFQALDGLARRIDLLTTKPHASPGDGAELDGLIKQYVHTAGTLVSTK